MSTLCVPTVKTEVVRPIACKNTSELLKMVDSCTSASVASYSLIEDYTQRRPVILERPEDPIANELTNEENEEESEENNEEQKNVIIQQSPTTMDINDGCFDYPF
ncbi:hypothetical protein EHI8A_020550 [Entamoeba histolytica HM-1:IMSS-B]|uniref:Uncharacterized protein n=6 Tax=Entamoeba histolytica TaxID=5759 RepID=C4LVZ1_ENTH1|nr:hypothetical protein EHI_126060 [Entamoeba histolytica HM-1:IMSS]EMD47719.1 Hypothetical protein EHI5A_043300 [Entamoeba histolytica KU27]EMH75315.1 hypothetical protein EHI8A_020550 [Entamoeba histolytica HM-1:IMSS-B]EMS10903.1 hypothetical protein KM1_052100 [Entamoeba histolytica HM-3:IMSS]ENY63478.1 hypothetical protein EHI7A_023060 [Entamoeba histolytica HM-1:IMSS-A]GAT92852.1 hypothetical protein CL6EHI_126060 [Entamoeba histolytica]|eukprot:XP_650407.1 hypothetical protein EHI_126060 [Entamoeba histolytica HM-1:IMSS]